MKLNKLNLQGKGELLNEYELKNIKGGYYLYDGCKTYNTDPSRPTNENIVCSGECYPYQGWGGTCQRKTISGTNWCVCE